MTANRGPDPLAERNRLTPGEVQTLRTLTLDPDDLPGDTADPLAFAPEPWLATLNAPRGFRDPAYITDWLRWDR